jgi:hypothetical protein
MKKQTSQKKNQLKKSPLPLLPGGEKRNSETEKEIENLSQTLAYFIGSERKYKHELEKAKYMIECIRKENKEYLDDRQKKETVLKQLAKFIFDLYFKIKNNEIWTPKDFEDLRNAFELARANQGYISLDELDKEKNKAIDEEINKNDCSCKD